MYYCLPPVTDNCAGEQILDCDLRDAILNTRQAVKWHTLHRYKTNRGGT